MRSVVGIDLGVDGAPSSTKSQGGQRGPEMHQTAMGGQWTFGMKAQVGVDSNRKLVHTVLASTANVHDREALPYLVHGHETKVSDDQGYEDQSTFIHTRALNAKDFTNRRCRYHGRVNEVEKAKNRNTSRLCPKVEHLVGMIKNIFGFRETRFRGLSKNLRRLEVTAALANLTLSDDDCSRRRRRVGGDCEMREIEVQSAEPATETGPIGAFAPKCLPRPSVMTGSSEIP